MIGGIRKSNAGFHPAPDAGESKLLEAYIMSRGNGLKAETPAVRY
ncbi:MAG TPA: hypothetical protein PLN94_12700 [Thiolinea sp.]|nr:hypothetical protein [Thiolinea sp.]